MVAQSAWGALVAAYLFLGGLSGGVLACAGMAECLRPGRLKRTVGPSLWIALAVLAAGVLCLLLDLGVPVRGLLLWRSFSNPQSWLSLGAWTLAATLALLLALDVSNAVRAPKPLRRALSALVALSGVAVMGYTGALLASCSAIAAWKTPLLIALFMASGTSCAASCLICAVRLFEKKAKARKSRPLRAVEAAALCLEAAALSAWLIWMAFLGNGTASSAELLVAGRLALPFWIAVVGCGIVAPAALNAASFVRGKSPLSACVASCLFTLVGTAALRWCVLACGMKTTVGLL